MPELKRAELIQGTVFLSLDTIGSQESDLDCLVGFLLTQYRFHTPGSSTRAHATWVMGPRDVAQPDIALFIRPDHGGATRIEEDRMHGVPELLVEITNTSSSRDLGIKLELYQAIGVSEYLTVLLEKKTAVWRRLAGKDYKDIKASRDGILRSQVFPGLWLNSKALFAGDEAGLLATLNQGLASAEHAAFVRTLAARKA